MKLIFCPVCHDVRKLNYKVVVCDCGASKGWYHNEHLHATIQGKAIPIGFANDSFVNALTKRPAEGLGKLFNAFVIPEDCPTVRSLT